MTATEQTADELMRVFLDGTVDLLTCKNIVLYPAAQPEALIEFHARITGGGGFTAEEKARLAQYGDESAMRIVL